MTLYGYKITGYLQFSDLTDMDISLKMKDAPEDKRCHELMNEIGKDVMHKFNTGKPTTTDVYISRTRWNE